MTRTNDPHQASWIESLHETISSRANLDESDVDEAPDEGFAEVRDCLMLLERARRAQTPESPRRVGRFEIVREVGRGGFGVVFAANDPRVGRQVALKVPRPEVLVSASSRSRFLREAQAAGVLAHPNLIAIYEVGEDGPLCYIASAFCQGPNLAQWLAGAPRPPSEREAATLIEPLARAVEHAHHRGVLHRDIKPSNVLLQPAGDVAAPEARLSEMTPLLTDFGLAKLLELGDDETRSGTLLGTPQYMAPEQAEGRLNDVGTATDVYALGAVLYELLAGRPPFRGESDVQTLQLVAQGDAPSVARSRPGVSRDLEAIALKCLERDSSRRYASAGALADDLERYLEGKPTLVRPARPLGKLLKWARRRPALAAMTGVVAVSLTLLALGGWWYSGRLATALSRIETSEKDHRQTLYLANLDRAKQALTIGRDQQAYDLLAGWIPPPGEPDQREFSWHYLWRKLHEHQKSLVGHTGEVHCVRYSPDGRRLATASQDQTVRIWDAERCECLQVLSGHTAEVNSVAYSPDGALLASASDDGTVRIWNAESGEVQRVLHEHGSTAFGTAFSPDGSLLATSGGDRRAILWNTQTWQIERTLEHHLDLVGCVAFSRSGNRLVTTGDDGRVVVWNVGDGKIVQHWRNGSRVSCAAFGRDDEKIAAAPRSRCHVWLAGMTSGPTLARSRTYADAVDAVSYQDAGNQFGIATKDGDVELLRADNLQLIKRFRGHRGRVWSLDFDSSGRWMATAGSDRTVKLWNLDAGEIEHRGTRAAHKLAKTADGRWFVSTNHEGVVEIRDLATGKLVKTLERDFELLGDFDGDGQRDSGYYAGGCWRLKMAKDNPPGSPPREELRFFGTAADIPIVADWDRDGVSDLGLFRPVDTWFRLVDGVASATTFGAAPMVQNDLRIVPVVGRWTQSSRDEIGLAVYDQGKSCWKFRLNDGPLKGHVTTNSSDVSAMPMAGKWRQLPPDTIGVVEEAGLRGERVLSTRFKALAAKVKAEKKTVWAAPIALQFDFGGEEPFDPLEFDAAQDRARNLGYNAWVKALAISPDGGRVAVCLNNDARVKVWDVKRGERIGVLRVDHGIAVQLAVSPDGRTLAVGTDQGEVQFFDFESLQFVRKVQVLDRGPRGLVCMNDGQRWVVASPDGEMAIWGAGDQPLMKFVDAPYAIHDIALSRDEKHLVAVGDNYLATVWNVETGEKAGVLTGHRATITCVAISPDGRTAATGGEDGEIKLWDLASFQETYLLASVEAEMRDLLFSNDGRTLISASYRSSKSSPLRLWFAGPPTP